MKTTENRTYEAPVIELVEFQAEQGFAASDPGIQATMHNYHDGKNY